MNYFKINDCVFIKQNPNPKFSFVKKFIPTIDCYAVIDYSKLSNKYDRFIIKKVIKILKSTIKEKPIIADDENNSLAIVCNGFLKDQEFFFLRKDILKMSSDKQKLENYVDMLKIYE